MPIGPTSGFLDFTNATPRANVIIALSNVGVRPSWGVRTIVAKTPTPTELSFPAFTHI